MKNTKLIGLVALLVVVVLVVSVVIATSADNALIGNVNKQFATYEDKLDELNAIIEKLNQGIIDANTALKELQAAGVQVESWNEATPKIPAKLAEALNAYNEFKEGLKVTVPAETEGDADTVLDYTHHYTTEKVEELEALYATVKLNIERATSVAAMDEFIANFKADLTKVETKKAALYALLATIDEGGVTIADFDDVVDASDLFTNINPAIFDDAAEGEEKDEYTVLSERIAKIYEDIKPLAISAFVDASKALPVAALYAPSNFEAYEKVVLAYDFLVNSSKLNLDPDTIHTTETCTGLVVPTDDSDVVLCGFCTERVHLAALNDRHPVVVAIKAAADTVNAAIEAKKDFAIEANKETRKMINDLWALVTAWEKDIVTDKELETYNAELYNLVNRAGIEAYNTALLAKIPELKAAADAYIAEVAKIGDVTNKSADIIAAAGNAYTTFMSKAGFLAPVDADYILGNTTENGVVAAWGVYTKAVEDLADINAQITTVENAIKNFTKVVCDATHAEGVTSCDSCKTVLDETKVAANLEKALTELKGLLVDFKGLDETAINADLLAFLKEAYVYNALVNAKNFVTKVCNNNNGDKDMEALLHKQIDGLKGTEIAFTLVVDCAGNHAEGETCNCTAKKFATFAIDTALVNYMSEKELKPFFTDAE